MLACCLAFLPKSHAEIKIYEGVGEYVMSDFETPDVAKERAKQRAEQNAQEQAGVFVNSYTEVNNLMVTKDEITVITSGILNVTEIKYDREFLSGEEGTLFRAKIKASIDTDGISKWLNMQAGEQFESGQTHGLQAAIIAQNKKIDELKRQLEDKHSNRNADYFKKEFTEVDNEFLSNQKIDAGNKYYFQGDYYSAISNYTQAIELNSRNTIAYRNRGTSFANLKKYHRAVEDFSKIISLEPNNSTAYVGRGAAYIALKDFSNAITDLSKAIQLNPSDSMAYYNRGICYQALNDMVRAEEDFVRAKSLNYQR